MLDTYKSADIRNIVTLRGDLPQDMDNVANEFHYANELVTFIRQDYGDTFNLFVAAYPEVHPEAKSAGHDLLNFKRKVDAGASAAITQYFYNADAYEDFVNRCQQQGITTMILIFNKPYRQKSKQNRILTIAEKVSLIQDSYSCSLFYQGYVSLV